MPSISQVILMALAVEWVVWFLLTRYIPDRPHCPICRSKFRWAQVCIFHAGPHGTGTVVRPTSFACPNCKGIIGVPSWRRAFHKIGFFVLLLSLLFIFYEICPPDDPTTLVVGYLGALVGVVGALRIADWFIWRRLEPGSPSPFTS